MTDFVLYLGIRNVQPLSSPARKQILAKDEKPTSPQLKLQKPSGEGIIHAIHDKNFLFPIIVTPMVTMINRFQNMITAMLSKISKSLTFALKMHL